VAAAADQRRAAAAVARESVVFERSDDNRGELSSVRLPEVQELFPVASMMSLVGIRQGIAPESNTLEKNETKVVRGYFLLLHYLA
jgi:hypothetical protein